MYGKRWMSAVFVCALLVGCGAEPKPIGPGNSDDPKLLVSGEIVRVDMEFSYNGEADFREGAHAVVTLCYLPFADAPCETLATQEIESIEAFPIPFLLEGDSKTAFSRRGNYLVDATVYMGPSDELYIGDFFDEIWDEVSEPTSGMKIVTSGLERCNTSESGGACATRERP